MSTEKHKQHENWTEIEKLVIKYKNGDKKACEELIQRFENYFNKFYAIIKYGKIDITDRETRFLLSMFVPKEQFKKSRSMFQDKETYAKVANALKSINTKFEKEPEEDIKQEMYLIFIKLLNRYEQNGKLFGSYLCTAFVYELSRYIKKVIKNPILFKNNEHYNDLFNENAKQPNFIIRNCNKSEDILQINDEVDFDDSWVLGITCSEEFLCLTQLERMILVKYYIEGLRDREISEQLGINRNILNQKRRQAVEKVKKKFNSKGV